MKKRSLCIFLAALLLISGAFLTSCQSNNTEKEDDIYFVREEKSSAGRFYLSLSKESKDGEIIPKKKLESIFNKAVDIMDGAMDLLSEDDPDSDVAKINTRANTVLNIRTATLEELGWAFELSEKTLGLYDPTCGNLVSLLEKSPEATDEAITLAATHTGIDKFTLSESSVTKSDPEATLYLGNLREGYALSKVIEYLKESPVKYGIASLNATAGVFGEKSDGTAFAIDIFDPQSNEATGTFHIYSGYVSVASSRLTSTRNMKTGKGEGSLSHCAVYSAEAKLAVILADLGYFHGSDKMLEIYDKGELSFEAVMTEKNKTVKKTPKADDPNIYTEANEKASEE